MEPKADLHIYSSSPTWTQLTPPCGWCTTWNIKWDHITSICTSVSSHLRLTDRSSLPRFSFTLCGEPEIFPSPLLVCCLQTDSSITIPPIPFLVFWGPGLGVFFLSQLIRERFYYPTYQFFFSTKVWYWIVLFHRGVTPRRTGDGMLHNRCPPGSPWWKLTYGTTPECELVLVIQFKLDRSLIHLKIFSLYPPPTLKPTLWRDPWNVNARILSSKRHPVPFPILLPSGWLISRLFSYIRFNTFDLSSPLV